MLDLIEEALNEVALAVDGEVPKANRKEIRDCEAGRRAIARAAMTEAVTQIHKGGLCESDARREHELDLQITLGYALLMTNGYAASQPYDAFSRAHDLCKQLDRPPRLGVLVGQFTIQFVRGNLEQAESYAEQIRQFGEHLNSTTWKRAGCKVSRCNGLYSGRFIDARAYYEKWLSLRHLPDRARVPQSTGDNWDVVSLVYISKTLLCLGYFDQARTWRDQALAEAKRRSPYSATFALCHASFDEWLIEGSSSAQTTFRSANEILALSREHGFPLYLGVGNILRGFSMGIMEQPVDGIPLLLHGLGSYQDTGARTLVPFFLTMLAATYGTAAQPDVGLNRLADADLIEATKERWAEAEMHRLRGDLLIATGDRAAAERSYRQAVSTAREQSAKLFELRAAMSLARLWRGQGKMTEARNLLAPVCGWFTEGLDAPVLGEAKALLS